MPGPYTYPCSVSLDREDVPPIYFAPHCTAQNLFTGAMNPGQHDPKLLSVFTTAKLTQKGVLVLATANSTQENKKEWILCCHAECLNNAVQDMRACKPHAHFASWVSFREFDFAARTVTGIAGLTYPESCALGGYVPVTMCRAKDYRKDHRAKRLVDMAVDAPWLAASPLPRHILALIAPLARGPLPLPEGQQNFVLQRVDQWPEDPEQQAEFEAAFNAWLEQLVDHLYAPAPPGPPVPAIAGPVAELHGPVAGHAGPAGPHMQDGGANHGQMLGGGAAFAGGVAHGHDGGEGVGPAGHPFLPA